MEHLDHNEQNCVIYVTDDRMRLLEDEVWAELSEDIAYRDKDPDTASSEFLAWRAGYKVIQLVENTLI